MNEDIEVNTMEINIVSTYLIFFVFFFKEDISN